MVGYLLLIVLSTVLLGTAFFSQTLSNSSQQLAQNESFLKPSPQVKGIETTKTTTPEATLKPSTIKANPKKSSRSPAYLGLWTQGFWDVSTNTLHPEVLAAMENKIGKKVAIAHYYRGWGELDSAQVLSELQTITANGWRPMISANPYFFDKCSYNGMPLYRAIASGNCDEFIKNIGRNLKKLGQPFFLRFAWEMNIPSMEWQVQRTGSTNADFIAAWQRMHNLTYAEGATNILWVFAPDVGNTSYREIYPGDAFIDWLGLDGYNWGTTQSWSSWKSFSQVFSAAYRTITRLSPIKPLMISEVNTTDQGGDKPAWYQDMLSTQIPLNFPRIKAIVFYNEDRSTKENVNWLIDVSPASLESFIKNIQNPLYLSSF